jgi:hypothetical protein
MIRNMLKSWSIKYQPSVIIYLHPLKVLSSIAKDRRKTPYCSKFPYTAKKDGPTEILFMETSSTTGRYDMISPLVTTS